MKIGIFHLGLFFSGGGERLVLEEASGLARRGHEVVLFAPVIDRKRCFPDLISEVKVKTLVPLPPFRFPLKDFLAIGGAVFLAPLTFWRFLRFDVYLGANQPGPLICYLLSRLTGKPYLVYLAQPTRLFYPREVDLEAGFGKGSFNLFYWLARFLRSPLVRLDRLSIQGAARVLVNGNYMTQVIKRVYQVEPEVCAAGCYPARSWPNYSSRREGWFRLGGKKLKKPYLLVTNRHFPQKKISKAITCLAELRSDWPELRLVVTGSSTNHTRLLRQKACLLGVGGQIDWLGLVGEQTLSTLYRQAAVYLYTSPEEDFGMGIIEAMAQGAPVVAWNRAGPTGIIKHRHSGLLVSPGSDQAFIRAVRRLLKDEVLAKKISRQGWYRASYFSYKKHLDQLERAFKKVINSEID